MNGFKFCHVVSFSFLILATMKKTKSFFKFNEKKTSIFLVFVFGTFVFWFLNKLSNEYSQIVYYPVHYTTLSNEFFFQEDPPEEIGFRIAADGFYFLGVAFFKPDIAVSVQRLKRKSKYEYYLVNDELKKQVRNSIKKNIEVVDVISDTLFVKLGKRGNKKIPVIHDVKIDYHLGYNSFSGIKLMPDSIEITGPEMQISKIDRIKLKLFQDSNVQQSVNENIAIVKPNLPKIVYSNEKVNLKIEVEKITEKTLTLPLHVINSPEGEEVVVYPKNVQVTCLVRLSQFNEIKPSDFYVVCDYSKRTQKHIKTQIKEMPSMVSKVKLNVGKVEYLILK